VMTWWTVAALAGALALAALGMRARLRAARRRMRRRGYRDWTRQHRAVRRALWPRG
jgi:hypothetical protein